MLYSVLICQFLQDCFQLFPVRPVRNELFSVIGFSFDFSEERHSFNIVVIGQQIESWFVYKHGQIMQMIRFNSAQF